MRRRLLILLVVALVMALALPALAITRGGTPDGSDHPYVGLMVADDAGGNPMWRCSGALISPTVYVTAGHCTYGASGATIWFEEDVDATPNFGTPAGYPFTGTVDGTPFTHPDYVDAAFFLYDVGVVVLDEPVILDSYASLPDLGAIDEMGKGRKNNTITAVGYGLQKINPVFVQGERVRLQADLMVVNTNGVAGIGSINPGQSIAVSGDAKHGGTCFGDSGGPQVIGEDGHTIGAVTSFGLNGNCAGIGGGYRIDQQDDLDFLHSFVP